jgi:hypothetical protein
MRKSGFFFLSDFFEIIQGDSQPISIGRMKNVFPEDIVDGLFEEMHVLHIHLQNADADLNDAVPEAEVFLHLGTDFSLTGCEKLLHTAGIPEGVPGGEVGDVAQQSEFVIANGQTQKSVKIQDRPDCVENGRLKKKKKKNPVSQVTGQTIKRRSNLSRLRLRQFTHYEEGGVTHVEKAKKRSHPNVNNIPVLSWNVMESSAVALGRTTGGAHCAPVQTGQVVKHPRWYDILQKKFQKILVSKYQN